MIDGRATASLVSPSISDERGKAFGKTMARAIADPDFKKLLFERIDDVDASVLPFLIREFSIEEFVEPDMSEIVIRRLLKTSYELHATKGFIHGVRRGLLMLGMRVIWRQWFQHAPKTEPGTHTATVYVNETIFDRQEYMLDSQVQRAAARMITGMKRYSQDVAFQLGVGVSAETAVAGAMQGIVAAQSSMPVAADTTARAATGVAGAIQTLAVVQPAVVADTIRQLPAALGLAGTLQSISAIQLEMRAT